MAHEISHVALRHGTAQASKATKYQIGTILGQIAGAIIGGDAGQAISSGAQFGFGTAFLKYGREYERQADMLGAQIMAARVTTRVTWPACSRRSRQGGHRRPRVAEQPSESGQSLRGDQQGGGDAAGANPVRDTPAFMQVQARLQRMPPAPTTEQAMKQGGRRTGGRARHRIRRAGRPGRSAVRAVSRPTRAEICSASACRRTGASCRATTR